MIQGEQYNLKSGFSSGYGFDGLVVGLLARGSTVGVILYAIFFGFLRSGGINMEISGRRTLRGRAGDARASRGARRRCRLFREWAEDAVMSEELLIVFLASSLRLAVPILFAATGELVSERAGVLNISLEGIMLSSAFAAAAGSWLAQDPAVGVVTGLATALLVGAFQAFLSVTLRANQIVVGLGINILALGLTTLLSRNFSARARRWIFQASRVCRFRCCRICRLSGQPCSNKLHSSMSPSCWCRSRRGCFDTRRSASPSTQSAPIRVQRTRQASR